MKRASLVILLGGSLLIAATAHSTTYVRVEKDGTKTYSDRPLPGGQPVDIQPAQTYSAPSVPQSSGATRSREQQDVLNAANFQYNCALLPSSDQTFQNPETVMVSVQLTPALRPGDQVKFSLDGAPLPNEENAISVALTYPERGSHTASVQITDRSGKTICSTSSMFHVQRTGLNSPQRRPATPPPRPTPRPRPKG